MQLGFIGIGKMGSRMAGKLLQEGHSVVVWNRTQPVMEEFASEYMTQVRAKKLQTARNLEELVKLLPAPRILWLMLPAGEPTQSIMNTLLPIMEKNDILIDGGNAHFEETQTRYEQLKSMGIRFLGIGVSGGIIAETEGYPIMVGGDEQAYQTIIPLLQSLAEPHGGYAYFGEGGAGHFVKMIHNGIEYGIMQSLGEGFEVLSKAPYTFDLLDVTKLWQKGTLVSGFMLDRVVDALTPDPTLSDIDGVIAESGEARWTVDQARKEGVAVEIIERSLDYRKRSQQDKTISDGYTAKLVAALRHAFGGHPLKKK